MSPKKRTITKVKNPQGPADYRKHINFYVAKDLAQKIDTAIETWGFGSRAEFFRYVAIEFLRRDAYFVPTAESLKEYKNAINRVLGRRHFVNTRYQDYYGCG